MARIELGAFRLQFPNSNHLTKLPSAVLLAVTEEWRTCTRGTLGGTQYRNTVRKNGKYQNTASKIV